MPKGAVAASAVYSLIPSSVLGANDRVNVGVIGVGGQGSLRSVFILSPGLRGIKEGAMTAQWQP